MEYCKKCVQPNTRPRVRFNEQGVCGACLWEEEKKTIDWDERKKEFQRIADEAKQKAKERSTYDCVLGVSGGKDTTFSALYAKETLGLNCLLVNCAPAQITEVGQYNIDNLLNLGFDMYTVKVNPLILKKMMKRDFYEYLNISRPTEKALWSSAYRVAMHHNIPLVIQGENEALTLGVGGVSRGDDANDVRNTNTLSNALNEYVGYEGITETDLFFYRFPDTTGLRAVWLQYYVKEWSRTHNAEFSIKRGMKVRTDDLHNLGRIHRFCQMDSDFHMVNQMFKYIKLGFGFATDEACYDIRDGFLTREEGIKLIKEYDGLCGKEYVKKFCDFISIDEEEFWRVVEGWRNKELFEKVNDKWELKSNYS